MVNIANTGINIPMDLSLSLRGALKIQKSADTTNKIGKIGAEKNFS